MSFDPVIYPKDTAAIETQARVLFGRRADQILTRYGHSARALIEASRTQAGTGWARLRAAQALHEHALLETMAPNEMLTSPRLAKEFLSRRIGPISYEIFGMIWLTTRSKVLCVSEMFRGTVDGASVHPREIVKEALRIPACAAAIAFHQHPAAVAEPSHADEMITTKIRESLSAIDVRLQDHVIIGGNTLVSLAERGLI